MTNSIFKRALFGGTLCSAGLAAHAQPNFTTTVFESRGTIGDSTAVVPVDLNNDGNLDFVTPRTRFREEINWYQGDGMNPPNFTKSNIGPLNYLNGSLVAADLDGDGDQDVAYTFPSQLNYGWFTGWLENDGNNPPSFTSQNLDFGSDYNTFAYAGHSGLAVADINGDGAADIVVTAYNNTVDSVTWFRNNGAANPSFTKHVIDTFLPLKTASGFHTSGTPRIADVTNDGIADIVVGGDGVIALYTSDGASPVPGFTKSILNSVAGVTDIELVDLNNDTYPDIVYGTEASLSTGTLGYLTNSGTTPPVFTDTTLATDGPFQAIDTGDIDNNGFDDFIVSRGRRQGSTSGNGTFWYDNDGPGFTRRTVFAETSVRPLFESALMDLNGDGDLDIVNVVSRTTQSVPFNSFDEVLFHENDLDPALPVITTQPQSQFVTLPATINLVVAALNAETFQWQFNGVDLIDGPGITGATTDTLAVNGTTSSPGVYTCIVTNIAGEVASAPAVIAVPADGAPNPGCNLADIAVPFGVLDLDDIDAFIASFTAGCP